MSDVEFRAPLNSATAAHVDEFIALLGSPRFEDRRRATEELSAIGIAAFVKLREAYRRTEDFEVRARIEAIVRAVYIEYHVYGSFGFLGIEQDTSFTPGPDEDARIPQGRVGIRIKKVRLGTGADRAGLHDDDIIIAFDGRPMQGAGIRAIQNLGDSIRSLGPGVRVKIAVLRGPQALEVEAVLGRPPVEVLRNGGLRNLSRQLEEFEARFDVWWLKYFRPTANAEN